ncbi:hypothetical protein LTR85_012134 [Meristemomyces frigidus]|nr:hypothetical protein LTR85_012134 [Meristemomyces frigidus]
MSTISPRLMFDTLILFGFTIVLLNRGVIALLNLIRVTSRRAGRTTGGHRVYRVAYDKTGLLLWCCARTVEFVFLVGCAYVLIQQWQHGSEGGVAAGAGDGAAPIRDGGVRVDDRLFGVQELRVQVPLGWL